MDRRGFPSPLGRVLFSTGYAKEPLREYHNPPIWGYGSCRTSPPESVLAALRRAGVEVEDDGLRLVHGGRRGEAGAEAKREGGDFRVLALSFLPNRLRSLETIEPWQVPDRPTRDSLRREITSPLLQITGAGDPETLYLGLRDTGPRIVRHRGAINLARR